MQSRGSLAGYRLACFGSVLSALLIGCALTQARLGLPRETSMIRGQLVFQADFDLARIEPLVSELAEIREELASQLGLPPTETPIHVYLFEDPARYQAFLSRRYPALAGRRAFFVETESRLAVYTCWGPRLIEDLRHEVTHGYLHAALDGIPLWLDEGLAEYFETPPALQGMNAEHLRLLRKVDQQGLWEPDLIRLESLLDPPAMTQRDYAESWLWVHFLLQTSPARKALLQQYVEMLRLDDHPPALSTLLSPHEEIVPAQLVAHLRFLLAKQSEEG